VAKKMVTFFQKQQNPNQKLQTSSNKQNSKFQTAIAPSFEH
jgi:hypothetical protein